jgi:hypothetical protein
MKKFARLQEKFKTDDWEKCCILYFWWDKANTPLVNGCDVVFNDISLKSNCNSAFDELSEKWYVPQCEYNWDLFFIKKWFFFV